ncbi:MAG: transketolase [Thermoplasmata archaeon]
MADEISVELVESLEATAREVRRDIIRRTAAAGSGYPGGSLSVVDLLVALIFHELRIDPGAPGGADGDRLVLSKGHAAPALYSAMAIRGFLPREELLALGRPGRPARSFLGASNGGPGQGIGEAVGMALAARLDRRPSRVHAILGDGECQAGATWEALLAGGHHRLENLVVLVDRNGYEADGATEAIMGIEPIAEKFRAFRYRTLEIDGHDFREILGALATARQTADGPTAIVARTVKGKGVSFMENTHVWHARAPSKDETERALLELGVPPTEVAR